MNIGIINKECVGIIKKVNKEELNTYMVDKNYTFIEVDSDYIFTEKGTDKNSIQYEIELLRLNKELTFLNREGLERSEMC